jgi:hypothetical protein
VRLQSPDELTVHAGEEFHLNALGSYDPDGDSLSFFWMLYPEEGDYKGEFRFDHAANQRDLRLTSPSLATAATIHFILKVTDKGTPPLTRYRRVVVHILPRTD